MTETTFDLPLPRRSQAPVTGALLAPLFRSAAGALVRLLRAGAAREPVSRRAREAAAVRALALRHRDSDRGFAADLYAAADRHQAAGRGEAQD
jgi:hypothetical protein